MEWIPLGSLATRPAPLRQSGTITALFVPADNRRRRCERNQLTLIRRVDSGFATRHLRPHRVELGLQVGDARAQRVDVGLQLQDALDAGEVDALVLAQPLDLAKQRDVARGVPPTATARASRRDQPDAVVLPQRLWVHSGQRRSD